MARGLVARAKVRAVPDRAGLAVGLELVGSDCWGSAEQILSACLS